MRECIKLELKKAFRNKFFWISIVIGIGITLLSFYTNIGSYLEAASVKYEGKNPMIEGWSAFSSWIGGEPFSVGTSLYFFLFPMLVALPYGWSYCEEKTNGYRRMLISQVGRKSYYVAKYMAVFLTGGVAMIFPLIVNFWMTLLVVPASCPDPMYAIYNAVFGGAFLTEWYYNMPFLYVATYLCIDFIFGGILAAISMSVTIWIRHKCLVVIVPFLLALLINNVSSYMVNYLEGFRKEVSLFYFLRGTAARYSNCGRMMLGMGSILFILTLLGIFIEQKRDIY